VSGTDIATRPAGALAVADDATEFTTAQLEAFGLEKASRGEQLVFLHTVQRTGLDPAAKQIYMIGRWDKRDQRLKHTIQTGIDGYRLIADRTGLYAGSDETWTENDNGWPVSATATVWKIVAGERRPFPATAHFREYVQTDKNGNPAGLWAKMPHRMIAKCAEALALRKAFPQDLSGIYTHEEMQQADHAAPHGGPDVVQGEIVTESTTPDGQAAPPAPEATATGEETTEQARTVAARAMDCADIDVLRRTYREAGTDVLTVDVGTVVPLMAAHAAGVMDAGREPGDPLPLGRWLQACAAVVQREGLSVADYTAATSPDTTPAAEPITAEGDQP
jgi:phage recombination protein Bet